MIIVIFIEKEYVQNGHFVKLNMFNLNPIPHHLVWPSVTI